MNEGGLNGNEIRRKGKSGSEWREGSQGVIESESFCLDL